MVPGGSVCVRAPWGGRGTLSLCPEHWVLAPEPGASELTCLEELQRPRQAGCLFWGPRALSFWSG